MNCPSCQHESAPGKSFCEECGGRLAPTCASCGAELSPTAKFCGDCGQAFEAYTPPHLAQKILTQRSALEGERKQITVLFADVKGSTELAERAGPEPCHGVLDRFFSILSDTSPPARSRRSGSFCCFNLDNILFDIGLKKSVLSRSFKY